MNMKSWISFIVGLFLISMLVHAYTTSTLGNVVTKGLLNSSGTFTGDINWTNNDNYPAPCSSGYYMSGLGDSVTCTDSGMVGGTWTDSQDMNQMNLTNIYYLYFGSSNQSYIYENGTALIMGRN